MASAADTSATDIRHHPLGATEHIAYRAEIDGLRGIAVLAVVMFHAGLSFSGGFVGVDVFFVISGYLLTSIILNDLKTGQFTFFQFWERRARRILPPVAVLSVAVLIAGWFLLLPDDFAKLGRSAVAQALFVANFFFWRSSGYFQGAAEEMPLLHTWSLAVEEQFYFILPAVLIGLSKLPRLGRMENLMAWTFGLAWVISFALSVYGVSHFGGATFFLLPPRAWELLTGSLVAIIPPSRLSQVRLVREIAALVGALAIIVPCMMFTKLTPFPGVAALPSCLGTALIIWSSSHASTSASSSLVARLLSSPGLVGIGLISYSLYLWHWPLFAFAHYLNTSTFSSTKTRLTIVVAAFVLAYLSWRIVETPFRKKRFCAARSHMFSFALGSGLGLIGLGALISFNQGFSWRFSEQAIKFAAAAHDGQFLNNISTDDIVQGRLPRIGSQDENVSEQVLVWGDSHAMSAMPAFDAILKERGVAGRAVTHGSTAPVIGWYHLHGSESLKAESLRFSDAVIKYVKEHQVRHVVLIAFWSNYHDSTGVSAGHEKPEGSDPKRSHEFEAALITTIKQLQQTGVTAWLMLQVPVQSQIVPRALARAEMFGWPLPQPEDTNDYRIGPDSQSFDVEKIRAAGCRILDPQPLFLNPTTGKYDLLRDDVVLYRDTNHLTAAGAKLILQPLLRREFAITAPHDDIDD